jgi:hypothetical protein
MHTGEKFSPDGGKNAIPYGGLRQGGRFYSSAEREVKCSRWLFHAAVIRDPGGYKVPQQADQAKGWHLRTSGRGSVAQAKKNRRRRNP